MSIESKKVVLLEDNQEHFDIIDAILVNSGYEKIWDFKTTKKLMADFESFKTCSPNFVDTHEENLNEKVFSVKNDNLIWIIDINWTGSPKANNADEYGLEFYRQFKIKKAIILSVNPREKYRSIIQGLNYISKFDENGNLFSDNFEAKLLEALSINPPKTDSPYENKRSK